MKMLDGNTKLERKQDVIMFNSNVESCDENGIVYNNSDPVWVPIGEDNDELTREQNNELNSTKNVLGKTNIDHTSGAETAEVDPVAIRGNDALSAILYMMFKYRLVGDKAKLQTMNVTLGDKETTGEGANTVTSYGAFTEDAIVDLKSWGGDTSKINAPITLNFCGNRVHGTYNLDENSFTPITEG